MPNRLLLTILFAGLAGCASKSGETTTSDCDAHAKADGVCPGVTSDAINADGIACSSTLNVAPGEESKIGGAAAGSCVVLSAGNFGEINLPASVSLIGKGSSSTTVAAVRVTPGTATIRGLKVAGAGISVTGKGALTVDASMIANSSGPGISAIDSDLTVTRTTINDSASFGIAANCKADCMARPNLSLRRVALRGNKAVGVWAHGVNASFDGVQVTQTRAVNFLYGRGFEVAEGGSVKATHFAVLDNEDVGVYVDSASAELSSFAVSNNIRGIQLQAIPAAGAKLNDFVVENNSALGIGITKGSLGIIVQGGLVASTRPMKVPVDIGGVQEVGDGINWLGGSEVTILNTVKIQSSARRAVIIESNSKGKFEGTLSGGDETRGIIVQGGLEPSMPVDLNIAAGVKSEVLTKDKAMPVAVSMAAMKAP
jgi:hypothetical protein